MKEIAGGRDVTLSDLVTVINAERHLGNLSSAIRVFVLCTYRDQIFEYERHARLECSQSEGPSAPVNGQPLFVTASIVPH